MLGIKPETQIPNPKYLYPNPKYPNLKDPITWSGGTFKNPKFI
jgi:hypothetical protein